MPIIVALTKAVVCPDKDVTVTHHVIVSYQVDKTTSKTRATLRSFGKADSRSHATHVNVALPLVPPAGDVEQWLYQALIDCADAVNVLHGAAPVYAAPAEGGAP